MARPCFVVAFALIFAGVSLVSGMREELSPYDWNGKDLGDLNGFQMFTEDDVIVLTEEEADSIEGMPDTIEDNSLSGVKWWKRASESEASFMDTSYGGRRRRRDRRRRSRRRAHRRRWLQKAVSDVKKVVIDKAKQVHHNVTQVVKSGGGWGEISKVLLCHMPVCDKMCDLQDKITAMRKQLEFLVTLRMPKLKSIISAEEERIESAKRTSSYPWTCAGKCKQEQKNAQELDMQNATSAAALARAAEAKVAEYRHRIALFQVQLKTNKCKVLIDMIEKVKSFIAKHLCLIISCGISLAAAIADKVLATVVVTGTSGVAVGIAALQAQPMCIAAATGGTGIVSKYVIGSGANIAMMGVSIMKGASKALCEIGKSAGKVAGEHIKEASKGIMNWNACSFIQFGANVILFALNVACGQLFSGVTYVIMPLIMCNLPFGKNGAKCQTEGCYF